MIYEATQILDLAEFFLICKIAYDVGKYKAKLESLVEELSKKVGEVEQRVVFLEKRKKTKKKLMEGLNYA